MFEVTKASVTKKQGKGFFFFKKQTTKTKTPQKSKQQTNKKQRRKSAVTTSRKGLKEAIGNFIRFATVDFSACFLSKVYYFLFGS